MCVKRKQDTARGSAFRNAGFDFHGKQAQLKPVFSNALTRQFAFFFAHRERILNSLRDRLRIEVETGRVVFPVGD